MGSSELSRPALPCHRLVAVVVVVACLFFSLIPLKALHWLLPCSSVRAKKGYAPKKKKNDVPGNSQLYLRVAWTSALKQFFLRTKVTSPIAKSSSPRLSDST